MTLRTYNDITQGAEEWHDLRRGMVTASTVGKLLTLEQPDALEFDCTDCDVTDGPCVNLRTGKPMKGVHDARQKLAAAQPARLVVADNDTSRGVIATLAAERISGFTEDTAMTSDMFRGVYSEPFARDLYSTHYTQAVEVGFMVREFDGFEIGYSPDGLVGTDGLIEIKAPRARGHINTVLAGGVPSHYYAQCQTGLLVTGRAWLDYVSYAGGLALYVHRVTPDPKWQTAILEAAAKAEQDITALVATYRDRVKGLPVADRIPTYNEVELKLA